MSLTKYRELRAKRRGVWEPPPPPVLAPPPVYPAVLAGTRVVEAVPLMDPEWGQYGWDLLIASPDPTIHVGAIRSAAPVIAGAFGTVDEGVTVHPARHNMTARVRVVAEWWMNLQASIVEARLDQTHPWPGPTLDQLTGRFGFGVAADGSVVYWRLWVPKDGARHGWFIGRTGAGKTGSMGTALLSACTEGIVLPVIIDMAGGASLGEWRDRGVPYADNLPDALVLLRRLLMEADRRAQWMADGCDAGDGRPVKWMPPPSRDVPLILPVMDEFPVLASHPEGSEAVRRGLAEWRKYLMGVVLASQGHQAAHAFGWAGGDVARQQIKAGNVCQLNGSVNSMVEALDLVEDLSGVGMIPRNQPGGFYFRGQEHPDVTRGRSYYEEDIPAALDRYLDLPDYDLPTVDTPDGLVDDAADPKTAGSCYDAVGLIIAGVDEGGIVRTSETNKALEDRWSPSTISDALQQHARDGHLEKDGRDRWRVQ